MLAGRTALAAGAPRGLGYAIAAALARSGSLVVLGDMDGAGCAAAAAQLRQHGAGAVGVTGNVALVPDVQAMVAAAVDAFGRLDVNGGILAV